MKTSFVAVLIALSASMLGCRTQNGTLVEVTVSSVSTLSDVAKLAVTATINGTKRSFDVPLATKSIPPEHVFAIDVPGSLKSSITVDVTAMDSNNQSVGSQTGSVMLAPGTSVSLSLVIGGAPPNDMTNNNDGNLVDASMNDLIGADLTPSLMITPGTASIGAGRYIQLTPSQTSTWSVVGGDANGTIDSNGIYNAPFTPGTYTIKADSSIGAATATITVKQLAIKLLSGAIGGNGNLDGVGLAVHFEYSPRLVQGLGGIYVFDDGCIRIFDPGLSSVATIIGKCGIIGTVDGTGSSARLEKATTIGSLHGNLYYVGDLGLRRIDTVGRSITTYPSALPVGGGASTAAIDAGMVVLDRSDGNLYAFDPDNAFNTPQLLIGTFDINTGVVAALNNTIYVAESTKITMVHYDGTIWNKQVIAGDGTTTGQDNSTGTAASFRGIRAMTVADGGWLIVNDGTCIIRRVSLSGNYPVITLAGDQANCKSHDGTGAGAGFTDLAISSLLGTNNGVAYVTDPGQYGGVSIRQIVVNDGKVTTPVGAQQRLGFADGDIDTGSFNRSFFLGVSGNQLIMPSSGTGKPSSSSVRTIDLTNGSIGTLAGSALVPGPDNGVGAAARFNFPMGVAVSGDSAYVTELFGDTIRKITIATGDTTTFAGTYMQAGVVDLSGQDARFDAPINIAACGNSLVVLDGGGIRKIDLTSATASTLTMPSALGDGSTDLGTRAGTDGFRPPGIACDASSAYLPQTTLGIVSKIDLMTGSVTTLAGTAGIDGTSDGLASAAQFHLLEGIAFDGNRTLYVGDDDLLRAIDTRTGNVTTVAGVAGRYGVMLGPVPGSLNQVAGLVVLPNGDLAMTDAGDNVVLLLQPQ